MGGLVELLLLRLDGGVKTSEREVWSWRRRWGEGS